MPNEQEVIVLWDLDNCHIPKKVSLPDVISGIKKFAKTLGSDICKIIASGVHQQMSLPIINALHENDVNFIPVSNTKPNAADFVLIGELIRIRENNIHKTFTFIFITGDGDFTQVLQALREHHTIIVIHSSTAGTFLKNAAHRTISWCNFINQIPKTNSEILLESPQMTYTPARSYSDTVRAKLPKISVIKPWVKQDLQKFKELLEYLEKAPDNKAYFSAIGNQLYNIHKKQGYETLSEYIYDAELHGLVNVCHSDGVVQHKIAQLKYKKEIEQTNTDGVLFRIGFMEDKRSTFYSKPLDDYQPKIGDWVYVQGEPTKDARDLGFVKEIIKDGKCNWDPYPIISRADPKDITEENFLKKASDERHAWIICNNLISKHDLAHKMALLGYLETDDILLGAEWQWDRKKLTFRYYNKTNEIVIFKDLLKDLINIFDARIWLEDVSRRPLHAALMTQLEHDV